MKRKITRKYIQCKEAYLDGFEEGFQRAYRLGEISKQDREPKTDALHASIMMLADAFENHPYEWNDPEAGIKFVEKLRAYERLKNKGFKFEGIKQDYTRFNQQEPMRTGKRYLQFNKSEDDYWMKENWDDLSLIFGGEEEEQWTK